MSYIYMEFYSLESVFTYHIFPSLLDDLLASNYSNIKKKHLTSPPNIHPTTILFLCFSLWQSSSEAPYVLAALHLPSGSSSHYGGL